MPMGKNLKGGFDEAEAKNFLETFREESAPVYRKPKEDTTPESPPPEMKPEGECRSPTTDRRDKIDREPVNPEHTDAETEYLRTYVEDCPISSFNNKGRQVMVLNEHRHKIQKITALLNPDMSIAGYIYNVLEKHFADMDPTIQSLFQKSKQI